MNKIGVTIVLIIVIILSIFGIDALSLMQVSLTSPENKTPLHNTATRLINMSKDDTARAKAQRPDYYDYIIGLNLKLALSDVRNKNCSIISGLIQDVKLGEGSTLVKQIDFFVDDWMTGTEHERRNDLKLIFDTRASNKADWNEKPFEKVKIEKGQHLILSYCPSSNYYRLVLSEEAYFQSVKEIIDYDVLGHFEEPSDKILNRMKSEKNLVFAGYIIERLSSMGTAGDVNKRAEVMVELLGASIMPQRAWDRVLGTLSQYLEWNESLAPSIRDEIIEKLVEIGSGKSIYKAEQSILLLVGLSKNDKINFKQYLNGKNSAEFCQNYTSLVRAKIPAEGRKTFENSCCLPN